jgi:hypothetical protein
MSTCILVFFTVLCLHATLGTIEEVFGASLPIERKVEGRCKLVFPFAEELKGEGNVQ